MLRAAGSHMKVIAPLIAANGRAHKADLVLRAGICIQVVRARLGGFLCVLRGGSPASDLADIGVDARPGVAQVA